MSDDLKAKIAEAILAHFHAPDEKHSTWWLGWADAADAVLAVVQPEFDRLERWKAEATEVILDLQELGKALGLGLGERITGSLAREAAERLTAERDEARAALARVEALVDEWDEDWREDFNRVGVVVELRAALRTPDGGSDV